jgi:DNA polymerase
MPIASAGALEEEDRMPARPDPATPPPDVDLDGLRTAAASCTACELHENATQTVFGEGGTDARIMLVGEQPGDREDLEGRPFVGPAGRLLDRALEQAGIDRGTAYVTNAVKHFRFTSARGGKLRLHQSPTTTQIRICNPWLAAEAERIRPDLVVCLGASAVTSVLGRDVKVTKDRGAILERESPIGHYPFLVTVHPSSILRGEPDQREAAFAGFVADLAVGAGFLAGVSR